MEWSVLSTTNRAISGDEKNSSGFLGGESENGFPEEIWIFRPHSLRGPGWVSTPPRDPDVVHREWSYKGRAGPSYLREALDMFAARVAQVKFTLMHFTHNVEAHRRVAPDVIFKYFKSVQQRQWNIWNSTASSVEKAWIEAILPGGNPQLTLTEQVATLVELTTDRVELWIVQQNASGEAPCPPAAPEAESLTKPKPTGVTALFDPEVHCSFCYQHNFVRVKKHARSECLKVSLEILGNKVDQLNGELIHIDLKEKVEKSYNGCQYWVHFTDDKTRFSMPFALKTKDGVASAFRQFIVEAHSNMHTVRSVQCDNASIFVLTQAREEGRDE